MLAQGIAFLYLAELHQQCCGTSASEVCEDRGAKRGLLWAVGSIPQIFGAKVESDFAVLVVMGEDKS